MSILTSGLLGASVRHPYLLEDRKPTFSPRHVGSNPAPVRNTQDKRGSIPLGVVRNHGGFSRTSGLRD